MRYYKLRDEPVVDPRKVLQTVKRLDALSEEKAIIEEALAVVGQGGQLTRKHKEALAKLVEAVEGRRPPISDGTAALKKQGRVEQPDAGTQSVALQTPQVARKTPPGLPPSSGGVERTVAGPAEDAGGALVRVPVRDGVLMVDNNIASSLSIKLTHGESALQEGAQTLAVRATERLGKPIVLTPTGSRELLRGPAIAGEFDVPRSMRGAGAIEKAPPVFPVAEIAPTSSIEDFAGLAQTVKTLREAGVGGSARRGIADRTIVAEAMVAGKQAGVVPEFLTTDARVIKGLSTIAGRSDPSLAWVADFGRRQIVREFARRGVTRFTVTIGDYQLVVHLPG